MLVGVDILEVNVFGQYALMGVMIVHLNVPSPGVKHQILCEVDVTDIVVVDQYRLVHEFIEVVLQLQLWPLLCLCAQ